MDTNLTILIIVILLTISTCLSFICRHKWIRTSNGKQVQCSKCGKVKNIACNHSYKEWKTINNLKNGKFFSFSHYILKCEHCGDTKDVRV